jgi:hypothetical protein
VNDLTTSIVQKIEARQAWHRHQLAELDTALRTVKKLNLDDVEMREVLSPKLPSPPPGRVMFQKRPCGCGKTGRHRKECRHSDRMPAPAGRPNPKKPVGAGSQRGRTAAPGEGTCDVCGRSDLRSAYSYHYAPEPCGLPCAGGPPPKSKEDAPDGVHSRTNCPRCKKKVVNA